MGWAEQVSAAGQRPNPSLGHGPRLQFVKPAWVELFQMCPGHSRSPNRPPEEEHINP